MPTVNEGGCLCGAIRFRAHGEAERVSACHCTFCQRLTGSGFGVWVVFRKDKVEDLGAAPSAYQHRSDESGRWIKTEFCPRCGTTIGATLERSPDVRCLMAGSFDDRGWIRVTRHIWTRSAQPWAQIPVGAPSFEKQYVAPA
jgi:hypothetical protein